MAIQLGTANQLIITIPSEGDLNWSASFRTQFAQKIVEHTHTGNGAGAKIGYSALINETDVQNGDDTDPAIRTDVIKDLAITTAKLAMNAVDGSKVAYNSITTNHIADQTITTDNIAHGTIEQINIKDMAVGRDQLLWDAVTTVKIQDDAVTTVKLSPTLRNDIAAASTNTSNISTNTSNISTNTSNISTNTSDISTNTTSISNIDTRVTSLESTSSDTYIIASTTDIPNLPTIVENATIIIKVGANMSTTSNNIISNRTFKNCDISLDHNVGFSACQFTSCSIKEGDLHSSPWYVNFHSSDLYATSIEGSGSVFLNDCELRRIHVPTGNQIHITNTSSQMITSCSLTPFALRIDGPVSMSQCMIDVEQIQLNPSINDEISIATDNRIRAERYEQGGNFDILLDDSSSMFIYAPSTLTSGQYVKIKTNSTYHINKTTVGDIIPAFKIINNVLTDFDKDSGGDTKVMTAGRGNTSTVDGYTFFDVLSTVNEASYDPDSIISSGQITLAQGNYLITASCELSTAVHIKLKMSITPSGGSKSIVREHGSPSVATMNDILLVASTGDILEIECGSEYAATAETNFTIKKIV